MTEVLQKETIGISPEEELAYLQQKFEQKRAEVLSVNAPRSEKSISSEVVRSFVASPPKELFGARSNMQETVIAGIVLKLKPESHDVRMEELYKVAVGRGMYTALKVVEKLNDPHLEDDFHRFVSELIREGHGIKGLKEKTDLGKSIHHTLFEVEIPKIVDVEGVQRQSPKELFQKMEGILSALQGDQKERETVTLEIANSVGQEALIFYASVPIAWTNRFENLLRTTYPEARVKEAIDDFNIFNQGGKISLSTAALSQSDALAIKTYETFQHDPMNLIIGAFGKLNKTDEGALLQIVYGSVSQSFTKEVQKKKKAIEKGNDPKDILKKSGALMNVFKTLGGLFKSSKKEKPEEKEKQEAQARQKYAATLEKIEIKLSKPIMPVYIRVAASGKTEERANMIRLDIESTFKQFSEPMGNNFVFKKVRPSFLKKAVRAISFRLPAFGEAIYLNTAELATIFHFESSGLTISSELKIARAVSRKAPIDLPQSGTLLGVNGEGEGAKYVYLGDDDRLRHLYVIGQTGTGKSTLLKNIIAQDIERGYGVCYMDPHGSDIDEILTRIPPERVKDVIYFDPANLERPMALNMLEYDPRFPEQKTFVVNELFAIFQKLYGAVPESMGPMFEQYFRNATLLTIEDPQSGSTLLHVSRVLADKAYREYKLAHCNNPVVVSFWKDIASKAGGEASLANIVPYITSKFDVFLANDYMRPIIAQEKSSLRFRDILDKRSILLVNLSKGRLGEINANLLGLIIVGKILMAALSRVNVPDAERNQFNLVIDEFQNVTTDSIATIFSEARKYKLSLTVAHQYIAQLSENISKAVFGNVGTLATFRVGSDDAEYLEKQFSPQFSPNDLGNLPNGVVALKLLAHGRPIDSFDIQTYGFQKGNANASALKNESAQKFGAPRQEVEQKIKESFVAGT